MRVHPDPAGSMWRCARLGWPSGAVMMRWRSRDSVLDQQVVVTAKAAMMRHSELPARGLATAPCLLSIILQNRAANARGPGHPPATTDGDGRVTLGSLQARLAACHRRAAGSRVGVGRKSPSYVARPLLCSSTPVPTASGQPELRRAFPAAFLWQHSPPRTFIRVGVPHWIGPRCAQPASCSSGGKIVSMRLTA